MSYHIRQPNVRRQGLIVRWSYRTTSGFVDSGWALTDKGAHRKISRNHRRKKAAVRRAR
ncbi:MAG TPA: hypothetical protein VLF41_01835 [Candidatus Nanoarchaeia archaeon]|nr:hypothetical protein [Candidatus Nanoarchaeia archaeon]